MGNKRNWKFWTKCLINCLVLCFMVLTVSVTGAEFVQAAEVDDLMYERTFSVQSTKNDNFITGANGAMANSTTAENVLLLKYGDEGSDWADNVPVAMYLDMTGAYLTLSTSARIGDWVGVNAALTTDGAEQFVLKKAADWSSTYLSYDIYHPQSGLYIAVNDSNYLYAYGKTAPSDSFVFTKTGYSDVGLLTTIDGYQQLTDDQKMRVLDVYGGIGAKSLFRYGGQGTEWTLENILKETVQNIYANRDTTTAEEEAAAMINGMAVNMYSGQTNWYGLPSIIPGTTGVKTILSEGIPGTYDFWSGTMLSGKQYTFSIIDDYGTHTMTVYIEDHSVAQTNAANLMEAIRQTPYPIRRNIRTIKVRNDGANSYNCGQHDLYMRLTWCPSVNDIAQYITHEFGHSMDYSYNVSGSGSWQSAINADIVKVSDYGSNNSYEDFAEFGRMYFQQYGNYNGMYAIRQLYPNRYARYVEALESAQYEDVYEKLLYLPEAEEETPYDGVIADFTFDDEVEGLRSGTAVATPSGTVVLDENGYSGSALYLDGTGSNFLTVLKRDNTSLLSGYDEFTISYYSKPAKDHGNWTVFMAPNANRQDYEQERYIGVLDKTASIEAERYNNYGQRSEALLASGLSNEEWRHVVLVVENARTTLYVDGEKITTVASTDAVEDILGNNSIFQIGKGNWGSGEYYQGYIDELTVYGRALTEDEVQTEGEYQIVAQFSFDDTNAGFKGAGAVAVGNGTYEISSENISGNSLYLDGAGFLNVTKEDGTPLLTGYDEMTLSYYSKVESYGAYWSFFLAQDGENQDFNYENYVGILDRNANVTVERYNNNGARPTSINVTPANGSEWKHVVVVIESGMTTLYIDGEQAAYVRSEYLLSDITGENSILQIGKGNWGNGEYFRGYIDEMTIWNSALSAEEVETACEELLSPSPVENLPFVDVTEEDWFYDVVYYNYTEGLMTGKSETIFAPDATLTRAELTSIVHRINGEPEVAYEAVFTDVSEDAWYVTPVLWAYQNKVVSGYAEGDFKPDSAITREQLAVIMHNYATAKGYATDQSADLDAFNDAAQVSDWAAPAVQWAVGTGVISGKNGVSLDPQGNATRAECAAIIQRFMENTEK